MHKHTTSIKGKEIQNTIIAFRICTIWSLFPPLHNVEWQRLLLHNAIHYIFEMFKLLASFLLQQI